MLTNSTAVKYVNRFMVPIAQNEYKYFDNGIMYKKIITIAIPI